MTRLWTCVLAVIVATIPIAPNEHVHEESEHGHAHVTVHRHFAPHAHVDPAVGTKLDDDDGPALTLEAVFTVPVAAPRVLPPAPVTAVEIDPPVVVASRGTREYVERLIHGPPRAPASLRAPPSISRL